MASRILNQIDHAAHFVQSLTISQRNSLKLFIGHDLKRLRQALGLPAIKVQTKPPATPARLCTGFQCPECLKENHNVLLLHADQHTCSACGTSHKTLALISGNWVL